MGTNFETEAYYSTDAQAVHAVDAVVTANAEILGKVFERHIGASDTVLSYLEVQQNTRQTVCLQH